MALWSLRMRSATYGFGLVDCADSRQAFALRIPSAYCRRLAACCSALAEAGFARIRRASHGAYENGGVLLHGLGGRTEQRLVVIRFDLRNVQIAIPTGTAQAYRVTACDHQSSGLVDRTKCPASFTRS